MNSFSHRKKGEKTGTETREQSANLANVTDEKPIVGVPLFLQRSVENSGKDQSKPPQDIKHSSFNGSPISISTRTDLEKQFNADFTDVKIHTDEKHQQLAKSLNAKAFTSGNNIVFGKNQYAPESQSGKRLLAHELTHVVQQRNGQVSGKNIAPDVKLSQSDSAEEKQADQVAKSVTNSHNNQHSFLTHHKTPSNSPTAMAIQRDEDEEQENGINYSIFPPEVGYRYGPLSLSANTSTAQLGMDLYGGNLGLGYHYGDPHGYPAMWGDYRRRYGADASQGNAFMTGSYGNFHAGVGTNFQNSFNVGFGYGAPLLPMPNILTSEANAAWPAVYGLAGAAPGFFQDPYGTYQSQEGNITALSDFGL
ncbi:MAG: DUF4157 domain-containing protein, partial [Gammaproteobacteria bacterium]|nr:DUF4157 domain-containing protein [Gammaproteobacteria bacterium]